MNATIATRVRCGAVLLPAHAPAADAVPWMPPGEGKAFGPLRFLAGDRGLVELRRLDPGAALGIAPLDLTG